MAMPVGPMVELVLPCLNEAPALPALFARIPPGMGILLVDNGSDDRTAEVAAALGATVVAEPGRGYGSAVHAGLSAATAEIVAVMDGDGSIDPADLAPLIAAVAAGRSDLACGRRRPRAGSWPWPARAGNAVIAAYLRHRTGLPLHDLAPVRVARRLDLLALGVRDRRSGYPVETLIRATRAGWRISEHDVAYGPRAAGTRSKVSGSARGTVIAIRDMAHVLAQAPG